jgi:SAM-dependent MidA family methyltransferase
MSLADRLRARIVEHGPMPFREFMEAALYDPEGGYYASGRASIGRKGDFYTSVSVGAIFGRLLARQFVEMWERLGRPARFTIVEQGAHTGVFAQDVVESIARYSPELLAVLQYQIVEPSQALATIQQGRLHAFGGAISCHQSLEDISPFTGVHFSNELLDAFPVVRAQWDGTTWNEQCVTWVNDRFEFITGGAATEAIRALLATAPQPLPAGYIIEVNPAADTWITDLSRKLVKGWVLAIDYGHPRSLYFRTDRTDGTLAAYSGHQRVDDFLQNPGEADLTAHVNFTSLAEAAERCGLDLCGFTDQHHLMVGLSQLHFTDRNDSLSAEDQKELRGFRTLMHPETMGQSFKAICFARTVEASTLSGFAFAKDARTSLELPATAV